MTAASTFKPALVARWCHDVNSQSTQSIAKAITRPRLAEIVPQRFGLLSNRLWKHRQATSTHVRGSDGNLIDWSASSDKQALPIWYGVQGYPHCRSSVFVCVPCWGPGFQYVANSILTAYRTGKLREEVLQYTCKH